MKATDLKAERAKRGLSSTEFADLLGYGGNANTKRKTIYDFEHGRKPIPPRVELAIINLNKEGK